MAASVYIISSEGNEADKSESQSDAQVQQQQSDAALTLNRFWPKILEEISNIKTLDLKQQLLPLARIKKIMKLDEDVSMISAEAPLLFAKASEIFIREITLRAWVHTEDNKRRTLQRNDIAMAITRYDQFDFLIDIVPREDIKPSRRDENKLANNSDQVHYYFQLAQQHHANLQQNSPSTTSTSVNTSATVAAPPQGAIQIVQPSVQTVQVNAVENNSPPATETTQAPVILQSSTPQAIPQNQNGNVQIIQQIVTPTGEIQQIPIQLTAQQLQMIKLQLQGNSSQPVIIQTPVATAASAHPQIIQVAPQNSSTPQVYLTQSNNSTESE